MTAILVGTSQIPTLFLKHSIVTKHTQTQPGSVNKLRK
jgi:hypothetical protein